MVPVDGMEVRNLSSHRQTCVCVCVHVLIGHTPVDRYVCVDVGARGLGTRRLTTTNNKQTIILGHHTKQREQAIQASAGGTHTMVLTRTGHLYTYGRGKFRGGKKPLID